MFLFLTITAIKTIIRRNKTLFYYCRTMANTRKQKTTPKKDGVLQKITKKKTTKKTSQTKKQDNVETEIIITTTTTKPSVNSLSSLIQDSSWSQNLQELFNSDNFKSIEKFLNNLWSTGQKTYPPNELIFEAFNKTPFDKVKVVLLGQDPYHDDGQVKEK